jgi:squalene synthase HpnC
MGTVCAMRYASEPDPMLRGKYSSQESDENFPVALRLLPARIRADLHAVYAVARTIDDLGDRATGDRVAALTDFRADLREIWRSGNPRHAVLRQLVPTVRAHAINPKPFEDLIEANLLDQRVHSYATYDDLIDYCRLSADPVGRLVLAVFGVDDPAVEALSDRVCRALQLVEHWQDVGEDRAAGRIYLPQEDLARFGVVEADLDRPATTAPLRALMRFETERATDLMTSGAPIVGRLRGWARVAVAGYVAGGFAAARALLRTDGDVLAQDPAVHRRDVLREMAKLLRPRLRTHGERA